MIPNDVIEAMSAALLPALDRGASGPDALDAALAAAEAMGWKLVPREPSGEMKVAPDGKEWETHQIWSAMYDAAPSVKP